jgi:hypothetical protein
VGSCAGGSKVLNKSLDGGSDSGPESQKGKFTVGRITIPGIRVC